MATVAQRAFPVQQRIMGGIIGGIGGGVVFGMMMAMMGMLPMVAQIIGSEGAGIGFLYHMFNSIVIGVVFGVVFGGVSQTYQQGALWGVVYGGIWWVLGPLVLMPLLLGMGLAFGAAVTPPMLMSLMGHLIYGVLLGLIYVWYIRR